MSIKFLRRMPKFVVPGYSTRGQSVKAFAGGRPV